MSDQTFISVGPYWDVLHRHRRSFYLTIVAGLALTAVTMVLIPKEYTSSELLEVWHAEVQSKPVGAEQQTAPDDAYLDSRLEALSEETITHAQLGQLISKHGLYFRDGHPEPGAVGEMAGEISITIPDSVLQSTTGAPNRWESKLPPAAVQISFQYRDPAKAQAVTHDLANIMIDEYRKERERHDTETIKLLSSGLDETKGKLAESQRQIKILKEKYRGSLPQDLDDNVKALQALQLQLERPELSANNKTDASKATSPEGPKPNTPDAALAALQTKLVALRAQYSDEYPEVIDTKLQIATLEKEIVKLSNQPVVATPHDSATSLIQQQIADYQRRIAETPAHEEMLAAVNRDYAILSRRYNDLDNLLFEARADQEVQKRGQGERLQVLQPASLPSTPSYPKPLLITGGGVVATLLVALAIPFGLFYTDSSFKDPDDVSAEFADVNAVVISRVPEVERGYVDGELVPAEVPLALPGNGTAADSNGSGSEQSANGAHATVDGESANHNGTNARLQPLTGRAAKFAQRYPAPPLVAAGEGMISSAADEFQLLAFKLRSWAVQRDAKVFVVASAVGGEGKSFVALNLAAALAVSGSGALLIDGDIRAPFQHYAFPVPKVDGLLGYLQGTAEFASTVVPTPVPGLSLLPAEEPATARRNISLPPEWAS